MKPPRRSVKTILAVVATATLLSITASVTGATGTNALELKDGPKVVLSKTQRKPPRNVKFNGQPMPGSLTTGIGTATGSAGDVMINGVPGYLWRDGCGPTAVGMVIGYYDGQGWDNLFPGDATSETAEVDQAISSTESYNDYAMPKETALNQLLADKSELGGAHASNSVADFLHTSWSVDGAPYGGSFSTMIRSGFSNYFKSKYADASITTALLSGTNLTWEKVKAEVDAARPMVFLVDSSGDGMTDHFVTVVAYRESNGYAEYGCWDTWNAGLIRWQQFRAVSSAYQWGVWGGFTFSVAAATATPTPTPTATATPTPTPTPAADTTAPVTTTSGLDSAWHNTSVTVSFSATDNASGVNYIEYSLNGGAWVRGTSVTVTASTKTAVAKTNTLAYRAVDKAGNVEATRTGEIKIDTTKPVTSSNAGTVTYAGSFTLVLTGSDTGSGVKTSYVSVDGKAYQPTNSMVITGVGRHTVKFYSVDGAGNVETAKSVTVRIG